MWEIKDLHNHEEIKFVLARNECLSSITNEGVPKFLKSFIISEYKRKREGGGVNIKTLKKEQ